MRGQTRPVRPPQATGLPHMYHGVMKLLLCAVLAACAACAQTFSASPLLDQTIEQAIAGRTHPRRGAAGRARRPDRSSQSLRQARAGPRRRADDRRHYLRLASLTKVVATTSSLMKLFEQGKFRLNDRVTQYLPEFQGGKSDITIRNLFTHFSGLPPGPAR